MRLQLDTVNKTIKVEGSVLLSELVTTLESMLPNNLWKKFTLEANVIIDNWSRPIIIERQHVPYYPRPWYAGYSGSADLPDTNKILCSSLKEGIYNVEA